MPSRSSIFSFDTLREPPRPSKSFLVATAMVLLSVALVHRFRETLLVRDPRPNARLANAVRYLRSQEKANPRILFLGSSRTQSCIAPEAFAEESGIPTCQILNLAQPSWGAWHALVLLRHASDVLSSVETAFVELTADPFNENAIHPITYEPRSNPDEFDIWATYPERAQPWDASTRAKLLTEYVLPLMQRRDLITWLRIGKQIVLWEPWEGDMSPPIFHRDAGKAAQLAADTHFEARTVSRYHLLDYRFSPKDESMFQELLGFLRAHGIEVVIFHPPVRAEYYDYLASDPRIQGEFEKFRGFVRDLAKKYHVVYWETLEDCGLDNSAVIDYGHFSREGAVWFTKRLYAQVHALDRTAPNLTRRGWETSDTSSDAPPQPPRPRSNIPVASPRAVR